jgi:hypothetical protein
MLMYFLIVFKNCTVINGNYYHFLRSYHTSRIWVYISFSIHYTIKFDENQLYLVNYEKNIRKKEKFSYVKNSNYLSNKNSAKHYYFANAVRYNQSTQYIFIY